MNITIRDNKAYCNANDLVQKVEHKCGICGLHGSRMDPSTSGVERPPDPDCPECKGQGYFSSLVYPFSVNLSNGNFMVVWESLGLFENDPSRNVRLVGKIDPDKVLDALLIGDSAFVERVRERKTKLAGLLSDCDIGMEQAKECYDQLFSIANEAKRRGRTIVFA